MEKLGVATQLPLEYWLQYADEIMTAHITHVLEDYGFTRSRWQVLDSVYRAGTIIKRDVVETMKTFTSWLDEILDEFVQEGWLVRHGDGDTAILMLTDTGKTEHEAILTLQDEIRRRALQGVTDQESMVVIEVLQRMVNNLA